MDRWPVHACPREAIRPPALFDTRLPSPLAASQAEYAAQRHGSRFVLAAGTGVSHERDGRDVLGAEFGEGLLHAADGQMPEVPAVDLVASGGDSGSGGRGAPEAARDVDVASWFKTA